MADFDVCVYYGKIPEGDVNFDVYPKERADEIMSVRNDRLKKEKYCAWKLLEYAITDLGMSFSELDFIKNESGKWACDKCFFSISHTDGAIAVAVSKASVGVDIEKVSDRAAKVAKKVFSEAELKDDCDDENLFTTRLWTKKESIFKTQDMRVFSPQNIVISDHETKTVDLCLNGEKYVISVAGQNAKNAKFIEK